MNRLANLFLPASAAQINYPLDFDRSALFGKVRSPSYPLFSLYSIRTEPPFLLRIAQKTDLLKDLWNEDSVRNSFD